MNDIKRIDTEDLDVIIPLLTRLNPSIGRPILKRRLDAMRVQGYQCVGLYEDGRLIGISGLWILVKYYVGKHIELDNVYILPEYQGKGVGTLLVESIVGYAKAIGCKASELNCYLGNAPGQKFWERQGYQKVAYHYKKKF